MTMRYHKYETQSAGITAYNILSYPPHYATRMVTMIANDTYGRLWQLLTARSGI